MRRLIRWISIITLCFMIATIFSGCGILKKPGFSKDDEKLTPASSIAISEEEARKISDKVPIRLYFADEENEKLKLEIRYIPISEAAKSESHLASIIVEELIKGPTKAGMQPTIPAGTKLLLPVSIDSGIATVNLSDEFVKKHPGGKAAEQMTIYSIVNSLTELKDISRVSFLIEGKARKDLKGSFAFDMPFPRSVALISMEVDPVDKVSVEPTKSPENGQAGGVGQHGKDTTDKNNSTTDNGKITSRIPAGNETTTGAQQEVPHSGSLYDEETGEILE